ncbi:MAG: hypothetical protein V3V05_01015 [Pontiella sp.]
MTAPTDQIWAYLHEQLSARETTLFEQALETDAELRTALEACRETHGDLENILPLIFKNDATDQRINEEQLIAEWEADNPKFSETAFNKPRRKIIRLIVPLAAAAAAIIVLNLTMQTGPIDWQRTSYGTDPLLRGQLGRVPHYSRNELKQVCRELQGEIEINRAESSGTWKLKISIQELANGALAVEVSGHPYADPNRSNQWNESFQNLDVFRDNLPLFGKQVADGLEGPSN